MLRGSARGQRGNIDSRFRKSASKLLTPMGNVTGGSIAVKHSAFAIRKIGELVKHLPRDVNGLSRADSKSFPTETHFGLAFENKVNFFLLLVVPRHLPAVWLERDVAHGELRGLDRARAAHKILCLASSRILAACNFG